MENLSMNNVLSGIERDLVVSYLYDCHVPFTLIPQQPADRIFSFTTGQGGVKILPEGIILFTEAWGLPQQLIGQQVTLRFYFKKLGLSFSSLVSCTKSGAMALVVPREILRLPDVEENATTGFSCNIFLGEAFSGVQISCSLREGYPLFLPQVWQLLPKKPSSQLIGRLRGICGVAAVEVPAAVSRKLMSTGKSLLVTAGWIQPGMVLPFDGCLTSRDVVGELDFLDALAELKTGFYFTGGQPEVEAVSPRNQIGSQLQDIDFQQVFCMEGVTTAESITKILPLIPICRYLAEPQDEVPPAVMDRVQPLELIYVSSTEMVIALQRGRFPLQQDMRYSLLLQIPVRATRRSITVDCTVKAIFDGGDGRICALCRLENLKTEDQRFLFESLNNSRYL